MIDEGAVLLQFRIVDNQVLQEARRDLVLRIQRTADNGRNGLIGEQAALVLVLRYHRIAAILARLVPGYGAVGLHHDVLAPDH